MRVWDVKIGNGIVAPIFEMDDGSLWQLCDVGLGWSKFEKPEPEWKINERIRKYLPSNINPRPSIIEAWNYEFHLAKGAIIWVKPSRESRDYIYIWGIKAPNNKSIANLYSRLLVLHRGKVS